MRISARCDYACKALLELSLHWPEKTPLPIQVISARQEIPIRYLVQILLQLKRQGLVYSTRGKQGGYLLAKPPGEISLGEVLRITGGELLPLAGSAKKGQIEFFKVWKEVETAMKRVVDSVTFEKISVSVKDKDKVLIYQI